MRGIRFFAWVALVALVSTLAYVPARAASVQGLGAKNILIGVQVSLTGPASTVGQGFKAGTQMAVDEINAHGGINGRHIDVVYEDDAGTAEGGISAVRRLMDQDKVFAIFGGGTSTSTASVIPLIQQSKFLYYDSLASDPRVLANYSPYVFSGMTVVRADVAAYAAKVLGQTFKAHTVGFLSSDEAFCTSVLPIMIPRLADQGIKVVLQEKFKSGDTDFTAQANAIKSANPDAMYLCGLPADGGRLLPQLKRAGISSKLLGDTVFGDTVVPKLAGPAADGFYALWINSTQFMGEKTGPMGEWKARFTKAFPNPPPNTPNSFSLAGYADFYVFADGLRRAGANPTQDKMIDGLEHVHNFIAGKDSFFTWAVPIGLPRSFRNGDHKGNRECVLIVVRNGDYTRVENFGT